MMASSSARPHGRGPRNQTSSRAGERGGALAVARDVRESERSSEC
jgi:hypothetical protein